MLSKYLPSRHIPKVLLAVIIELKENVCISIYNYIDIFQDLQHREYKQDCLQVECTVGYTAQQPGELSLEPDDVINVIQKTPDGWLKGQRLGDGERGWFPWCFVKEISNEHVQWRNLWQRHRVLQTTNKLVSCCTSSRDCRVSTCFRLRAAPLTPWEG
ncbi:UNVERIFIED_CONTAM: hypothetical protein FKN15_023857 [Acipenser sinensis]